MGAMVGENRRLLKYSDPGLLNSYASVPTRRDSPQILVTSIEQRANMPIGDGGLSLVLRHKTYFRSSP
jgi:hypothetical protein